MLENYYLQRRQALFNSLPTNAVALIPSGNEQIRNRDTTLRLIQHMILPN